MANRDHHDNGAGTVAILGGAGLLAWLLLRRGGASEGSGTGSMGSGAGASASATTPAIVPGSRCVVWILPGDRLEVDRMAADLSTVIARCRTVEYAEVHARGDARQGFVTRVVQTLYAAGITLHVAHDLATIVPAQVLPKRNIGPSGPTPFRAFDNVKTFDDLFIAQRRYLAERRGADRLDPEPGMGGGIRIIPRSTNADVITLADYWTQQLRRVKRVFGAAAVEQSWAAALAEVDAFARTTDPSALYRRNNAFWRVLQQTAIQVAVADEAPSTADLMLDALKDSLLALPHNLVAGVQSGASAAAEVASNLAHGVGGTVGSLGRGLLGGLGMPVLVGGGALVAIYLLARNNRTESGVGA